MIIWQQNAHWVSMVRKKKTDGEENTHINCKITNVKN